MTNVDMIYGGFDPTFIDINIQPTNKHDGKLISQLPKLGSHHIPTEISLIPGGNGFNFCRTLATLGRDVTFVGPSSPLYEKLIEEHNIPLKVKTIENAEVNYTGILNLRDGEVQFNSIKGRLSVEHLTTDVLNLFAQSPLKSISNVALNPTSIEWISSLILRLWSSDILTELESHQPMNLLQKKNEIEFDGVLFIDPSDISKYDRMAEFYTFLKETRKLKGEKYLSVNEIELKCLIDFSKKTPQELYSYLELPIIFHSSDEVKLYEKEDMMFVTKKLESTKTFVGAGDCFNGSFLHYIFDNRSIEDSLKFAIEASSHLIETGTYPLSYNY